MRCCEAPQNGLTCGFSAGAAGQRFYGTFTRTKNERQTRRLGWDSLMSRSDRCKRSSGAAAATGGGHFSQHSVKLPPQGQVSGEIGPRALGNGGFREFKVEIRPGRGGQSRPSGLATPPIPGPSSSKVASCQDGPLQQCEKRLSCMQRIWCRLITLPHRTALSALARRVACG